MGADTKYSLTLETGDAQQKVDDLDEGLRSCSDRLDAIAETGADLGGSIAAGAGKGLDAISRMGSAISETNGMMSALASAGTMAGQLVSSGMSAAVKAAGMVVKSFGKAEASANSLAKKGEQTGGRVRDAFVNAASVSDRMGISFAKNFNKAQADGKSFEASIKNGLIGAFDSAGKKAGAFSDKAVSGLKKIGTTILHPVQALKGSFSSAMKNAEKDVDKVGGEAKQTEKDLKDMGSAGGGAGNALSKGMDVARKAVGSIASVAASVVSGIVKFSTAALGASQAAENISYSFDQSFGDAAPDVNGWAENFAGAIRRSETEVKGFLSSNKQMYEGMGITGDAANYLSKATTSLAYDIGNKFGIADTDALTQLQDALGGNEEALAAYGVRLDETALKQSAEKMGFNGSLEDLDEASLVQLRYNSILEQTEGLQQNASQSLGGFAGGVKSLKAGFTDFLEQAGDKLAPVFDQIFGVILDAWPKIEPALLGFVDLLANGLAGSVPLMEQFATDFLPQMLSLFGALVPVLGNIGGALLPVLSQVLDTVAGSFEPLMPLISTLTETVLPPLAELFGTLVEKLLPPLANLLGSFSPIIEAMMPILDVWVSWIGLIAEAIAGLVDWLAKGIEKLGEFLGEFKDTGVGKFVAGITDGIGAGIDSAASGAHDFFAGPPATNAKGTDNFAGGWTRIHEAGDEMIQAKHSGGLAFLPRGSAVIPASRTDELLSDDREQSAVERAMQQQPDPSWEPVLVEGNPNLNRNAPTTENPSLGPYLPPEEPEDDGEPKDRTGAGGSMPPLPDDSPGDSSSFKRSGGELVTRKVIELNIAVSSPDGTVTRETLDEIRRIARQEAEEAIREDKDDELNALAIQEGYAG